MAAFVASMYVVNLFFLLEKELQNSFNLALVRLIWYPFKYLEQNKCQFSIAYFRLPAGPKNWKVIKESQDLSKCACYKL